MANITSLTELTEVADDDLLVAVDKSDTTMADSGTDKKVKKSSLAKSLLDFFYPVGTIYETTSGNLDTVDKMNTHFGGTWEAYGSGRVLVGKSADTEFDTIGKTGGDKTHIHRQGGPASDSSGSAGGAISGPWNDATFGRSSSGVTFANYSQIVSTGIGSNKTVYPFLTESTSSLQPYIVVYRYRRTA